MKSEFDKLLHKAQGEVPFGLPREYGFETALRSTILSGGKDLRTLDVFGIFCWRFSLLSLPVFGAAIIAITLFSHLQIPHGMGGIMSFCTELISPESLSLF